MNQSVNYLMHVTCFFIISIENVKKFMLFEIGLKSIIKQNDIMFINKIGGFPFYHNLFIMCFFFIIYLKQET